MSNIIEIVIKQSGQGNAIADASKALGGLGGAAKGITGMLGGFGSALGNVATIAGGIVAANVFGKIVDGVTGFVSTGLDAVGASQQLETSLKALLTQNLMYEQTTETVTAAVTKQIMSQEELGIKYDELTAKLATQKATYQEQSEALRQLTLAHGENALDVLKNKAAHEEYALKIADTEREIAGLTTAETKYTTFTKQAWQATMDQAEAFKLASIQTRELLDFVSALAVVSPFETEDVENVTKYAIAAGMGVDSTKEFVPAFLDLAGAVGITSDSLGFAADQLFQVKKIGKLTEVDLRQLRRLGIDLSKIIGVEMGMSVEEFNKKAETTPEIFDELFASITKFSSNTFAGTAKEMALSVKGLQSTFSDIFVIGARTFLRPLVDAMTPTVAAIASKLSDFVLGGDMAAIGQELADRLFGFVNIISSVGAGGGLSFLVQLLGPDAFGLWRELTDLVSNASASFSEIGGALTGLLPSFSELATNIIPAITATLAFVNDHFEEFRGALVGIGAVIAGGIFVSLVAGLLALLTPINLIIAGAALLGAAWAGNWGGIQEKTFATWAAIQPILIQIGEWLSINLPIAIQFLANAWNNILFPALILVSNWLTTVWFPLQVQWYNFLSVTLAEAIITLSSFWTNTLLPALTSVGSYISTNLTPLMQAMNDFIVAVFNKTIQAAAGLWQNVLYPALRDVWAIIDSSLQPIFESLGNTISEDVSPLLSTLSDNILPTLTEGLKTVTKWIKEATDFFKGLANAVENFQLPEVLQRHSPSPFEQSMMGVASSTRAASLEIGKFQRLLTGVDTSSGEFLSAASKIMQRSINFTQSLHMGGVGNIAQMARNVFSQFTAQIVRSGEAGQLTAASLQTKLIDYLKLYNKNVPATLDYFRSQGLTFEYLAEQLNTSFGDFMRELRLQAVSEDIGLAGRFASFGQAVVERLSGEIETLQSIVNGETAYYHNQILTNVEAQELLNQKLKEQAGVQQEINALAQQQADLQFLQQQVDLIKLVEERGLKASDIFQGITFGLDASLPDLIKATSNVVQAMIDQIDSDLGIASPSKVMTAKFQQVGAGMVNGLLSARAGLSNAIGPIIEPVMSSGERIVRQTNNYFNQTVNTRAESSSVIGDFRVMQMLLGA